MATPRVTIDELPEQLAPEDTNEIVIQDSGVTKKMSIATLKTLASNDLTAHLTDTTAAHAATAISATSSGVGVDGPNVQSQLGQLTTLVNSVSEAELEAADVSALADEFLDGTTVQSQLTSIGDLITTQGVPAGGSTGQVLAKASATDYDTEWTAAPTGGGGTGGPWASMTQEEYDLLVPDSDTLYVIVPFGGGSGDEWAALTQEEFDGLDPPNPDILYVIVP